MAEIIEVKQYLAHWFQLGKKIVIANGREALLPEHIFNGERFSVEFEDCWQKAIDPDNGDCYLEGSEQTIQDLLSSEWDFQPCARCALPVPIINIGQPNLNCTCHDLENWPDSELPAPHLPVNSQKQLDRIRASLSARTGEN